MKVTKPMRGRRAAKRLDVAAIRDAVRDGRTWTGLALVQAPPEGGEHYELVVEDGVATDLLVEVSLMPDNIPLTARMSGFAGTAGAGVWSIPNIDDEVVLVLPMGDLGFMPMIVGVLASRSIPNPNDGQGPALNRTIIVNSEVLVHDGTGGAVPLALKSELVAVDNKYTEHIHQDSMTGPTGPPIQAGTLTPNPGAPPPFLSPSGTALDPADIVGTTVLLAK